MQIPPGFTPSAVGQPAFSAQAPVADPPVADVPVVDVPVADAPVVDVPVGDVSAGGAPFAGVPVADAPYAGVPVGDAPFAGVPVANVPAGDLPFAGVPVGATPMADPSPTVTIPAGFTAQPMTSQPMAGQPVAAEPVVVAPVAAAPPAAAPPAAAPPAAAPAAAEPVAAVPVVAAPAAAEPDVASPIRDSFATAAKTDLAKATTALDAVDKQSVRLDLDKQGVADLLKLVSQARSLVDNVHGRAVNNLDVELKFGNNWVSDAISRRLREVAVGNEESAVKVIGDFMKVLFEVEETIREAARNLELADDEAADAFGAAGEAKG
ncbi:hypothetical protein F4560_006764 [Saccharothrix ecbatanensis]|uniref:Uncharacterized protein n=1 Tax=Saccharothrix ecbatanensis TaxID=1105145 RepID=A0A7W9M4D4_9PSEU|nr:hypothetical protein [Saccharothrix ecbatanensis]MBB5806996.1 hypothetical protein [Saccharothrix ecbatanensis]